MENPIAWIVKWTQKSIPPEHASAYLSEDEAKRAAENIKRYADVSNVVVIPAFAAPQRDYAHEDCSGWSGPAQHNPYHKYNPYE